ncbi:MAG: sigma-70 family RNA polymerase sigma factor [Pseudomonadales bacterium]
MTSRLKGLAYQMLGSVADAEDIVQEAQLRLHQVQPKPVSTEAFLYKTVSNLCIDRLRRLKIERKHYQGPWLPEPFVDNEAHTAELAQDLSIGFILLLETLSPAERVVYVLREGFEFTFTEIADLLDISAAAARQRAHRATVRLKQQPRVPPTPAKTQKSLLDALMLRMAAGDVQGLIDLMSEDAVAYTDGGGVVSAAIRPVTGRERIVQVAMHLVNKASAAGPLEPSYEPMNGGWAVVVRQNGEVFYCMMVDGTARRVSNFYVIRNPNKLSRLNL